MSNDDMQVLLIIAIHLRDTHLLIGIVIYKFSNPNNSEVATLRFEVSSSINIEY